MLRAKGHLQNGFVIQTTAQGFTNLWKTMPLHEALEMLDKVREVDPEAEVLQVVMYEPIGQITRRDRKRLKEKQETLA